MAKTVVILKYLGSNEGVKWHNIKWTYGKEVRFDAPEDILAVRAFMKRPDANRNWRLEVQEEGIIGPPKTVAVAEPVAPHVPEGPKQTVKELAKATDALDEVLKETKPKRNYVYNRKKR